MSDRNTKFQRNINREPVSVESQRGDLLSGFKTAVLLFSAASIVIAPTVGLVFGFWRYQATEKLNIENSELQQECRVLTSEVDRLKEENIRLSDYNRISESAGELGMFECPESSRDYVTVPGLAAEENGEDSENDAAE